VTFDQTGVGSDVTVDIVTIDSTGYGYGDLPESFWWDDGSSHSFSYGSPLDAGTGKQYVWTSTTGLSTAQSDGSFTVSGSGTITGVYKTQYKLTGYVDPNTLSYTALTFTDSGDDPGHDSYYRWAWYDTGTVVQIMADWNPSGSYFFGHWSGDLTGSTNPDSVTMTEARTVTAHYNELPDGDVTTSSLCDFDFDDDPTYKNFRLIFTPFITDDGDYKLSASNPGQFYYNIFYLGTPTTAYSIDITIPEMFETQGAMPIHVYSQVDVDGCSWVPINEIASQGPPTANPFTVSGTVPDTGLVYITVHVDFKYKKEVNYEPSASPISNTAANSDSSKTIPDLELHTFSCSGDHSYSEAIQNINIFKNDPGFIGFVIDSLTMDPVPGETVEIYGPDGSLLGSAVTDDNGYYFYYHKHLGKRAEYTVKHPDSEQEVKHTLKANKFVQTDFLI
jgi:hypothetical protein